MIFAAQLAFVLKRTDKLRFNLSNFWQYASLVKSNRPHTVTETLFQTGFQNETFLIIKNLTVKTSLKKISYLGCRNDVLGLCCHNGAEKQNIYFFLLSTIFFRVLLWR